MERTLFTNLSPDELRQIIVESVQHCLKVAPPKPETVPGQAAPPYVSKKEAARLLGVCVSSVDNAARRGDLTRQYVGKAVRFDRQQVLQLAKSHLNHKQKN